MTKSIIIVIHVSFLIIINHHLIFAQEADTDTTSASQEKITNTNQSGQEQNQTKAKKKFTNYFSSRTTHLNSIALGVGEKFNLWYYYMNPLLNLERMEYISFGLGFGGKGIGYVTYREDGVLIDTNDNSYFFFLGGSIGFTFFITERIFLHPAIGTEYWFGDTHSGANYTYEYEDGYDPAGGFRTMFSIGLYSVIKIRRTSTTSIGFAINQNSFNYTSYNIVFTFY